MEIHLNFPSLSIRIDNSGTVFIICVFNYYTIKGTPSQRGPNHLYIEEAPILSHFFYVKPFKNVNNVKYAYYHTVLWVRN